MTYNPTTHSFTSKITPQINPVLKQGFVFSSGGAGCLNYGVRNLIAGSTTKMRWQFKLNTVAGAGTRRYICSEYNPTGNKRSWGFSLSNSDNKLAFIVGGSNGTTLVINTTVNCVPSSNDFFDIVWNAGVLTTTINNTTVKTNNLSATATTIYSTNSPNLNVGGQADSSSLAYNGSLCCFKIWVDNILDTDTPKFVAPMCDKTGRDIISGTKPTVVGTVDMTARADDASFYCEEHGFAVKTGAIYPKLLSGTGYAGNPSAPYTEHKGLIELRGSIDIAGWNNLDTLIDFGGSIAVKATGLRIAEMDGVDCNLELIYVAEPKLDPADIGHNNALHPSVMNNEAISIYSGALSTDKYVFFKIRNLVMKMDGSGLAESGIIEQILVYDTTKITMTNNKRLKILRWLKALPFQSVSLTKDVNNNYVFDENDKLTYTCLT